MKEKNGGPRGNAIRRNYIGDKRPCARCDKEIIVTEQMTKYGKYICSQCASRASAEYVQNNKEKKRKWNNEYLKKNPEAVRRHTKKYREDHPEKYHAHIAVQTALRNGVLRRERCVVCGDIKVHAHHDDYSKPLSVIWLCHNHHMEKHVMIAEREKGGE